MREKIIENLVQTDENGKFIFPPPSLRSEAALVAMSAIIGKTKNELANNIEEIVGLSWEFADAFIAEKKRRDREK